MADYKYLNETGLNTLWAKIKARVKILSSADISTSVEANVGTIVVNDTSGAAWVVLTATNGKAATWRKLSNGDIEALKTSVNENADAINDIINSIGKTSGYRIVKNSGTTSFNADEIIAGTGNSEIEGSGMYFSSDLESTSDNTVPTSKAVADYVAEEITAAQQAAIKTYAISVDATAVGAINSEFKTQSADVSVSYTRPTTSSIVTTSGTTVSLSDLKVGDVVYIKETGYPDRWVSSNTGTQTSGYTVVFSKLETQDLSIFVQKPDSSKTGNSNQTITTLGVDSNNKLTATWSNIVLGNIKYDGTIGGSKATPSTSNSLIISQGGKIANSSIAFDTGSTYANYFLNQQGKWSQVDVSAWKSIFTAKGQLIYSTAASTVSALSAITPASGSQAMLTLTNGLPSWDTITPISDDTINALS